MAALVAVVLTLPSLAAGLAFDDFFQRAVARGEAPGRHAPLDLFNFCWGREDVVLGRELGILPWFMAEDTRLAFWRPLASATHWVDYNLWPDWPWLMHAQNLVWYGLAVLLVARLYRRVLGAGWVAGLAAMLYALDDAHALPVAFVANRNAIMALVAGAGTLLLHDRWRRDGWRAGAVLGPGCLLLGVLSAEAAIASAAYLASYALWLDRGSWRQRLATLLPYGGVIALWQIVYRSLGYRIVGSGIYLDPLHEPRAYAAAALERAAALLLGQLATPPSDMWNLLPRAEKLALWIAALVVLGVSGWVIAPLLRRDRATRFFLFGALCALLPVMATFPSDRLLLFVGIGAMGVVAQVFAAVLVPAARSWQVPARGLAAAWVALHLLIAPFAKPFVAYVPRFADDYVLASAHGMTLGSELAGQRVLIVNAPNYLIAAYRWSVPRDDIPLRAARAHVLSLSMDTVEVERTDGATLTLRPRGWFFAEQSAQLFRAASQPLRLGDVVTMRELRAEVSAETSAGRPAAVSFRLPLPLEDPSYRWIAWDGARFVDFVPPPIGSTTTVGSNRGAPWLPAEDE